MAGLPAAIDGPPLMGMGRRGGAAPDKTMEVVKMQEHKTQKQKQGAREFPVPLANEVSAVLLGPLLDNPDTAPQVRAHLENLRKEAGCEIVTPRNTADEMHIAVPGFSCFDEYFGDVRNMNEEQMEKVSGGLFEIVGSFGLLLGFAAGYSVIGGVKIATAGTLSGIIGGVALAGLAASQVTMYSAIGVGLGVGISNHIGQEGGGGIKQNINICT